MPKRPMILRRLLSAAWGLISAVGPWGLLVLLLSALAAVLLGPCAIGWL